MSWKIVEMGSFLEERKGRYKPNEVEIANLQRIDKIDFDGNIYLSDKPSKTDMILIKKDDLVISGINVEKGAMAVYQGDFDIKATIHYSSYLYRPERIDIFFLQNFLKSPAFVTALKEQVPGGIKTEIKSKHILPLKVYLPANIQEQREIVNDLKQKNAVINSLSSELKYQLDLVNLLRQAFLREAMQGKLVHQDPQDEPASVLLKKIKEEKKQLVAEGKLKRQKMLPTIKENEIPFEIPKSWVWTRLGELAFFSEAGKSFKCQDIPVSDNEWGVIKVSAVSWDKFLENENKLYSQLAPSNVQAKIKKNDFIISRANTSDLVGKSVIVKKITRNLLLSDKTIRFSFSKLLSTPYINICNNSFYARLYYASQGTGSSPSMKNITRKHMNELLIPFPPLPEQKRIVKKLDELMEYCDQLEESIKNSQRQNELLLQQVLREALEPRAEQKLEQNNVVVFPDKQQIEDKHFLKRKILATYILNQSSEDEKLGDVKFEKLLHLADYVAIKRNLGQRYLQKTAGPYDNAFTYAFFTQVIKAKWFKKIKLGNMNRIVAGDKNKKSVNTYGYFSEQELERVNKIIKDFRDFSYEEPEIISTLYAVWNNRIIKGLEISDESLKKDFLAWDKQKVKYKNRLDKALAWMRSNGYVPDGWGNLIQKKAS